MHKTKKRKRLEKEGKLKPLNLKPNAKTLEIMSIPDEEWTKTVTNPREYTKGSLA